MLNLLEFPFRALGQIGPRLIMIAAMVTSYTTQHELFLSWKVEAMTAALAPAVIDVLAITCAEILHDQRVVRGKVWAAIVLALAGAGSMAANFMAGATWGSRVVHASMVLAYVLAELVVGSVRRGTVTEMKVETPVVQATVTEVTADDAASPDLPEAPVSPAAPSKRGDYGPRDGVAYKPSTVRAKKAAARKATADSAV